MFEILGRRIAASIGQFTLRENSAFSGYFVAAGGERGEGRTTKVDHGGEVGRGRVG